MGHHYVLLIATVAFRNCPLSVQHFVYVLFITGMYWAVIYGLPNVCKITIPCMSFALHLNYFLTTTKSKTEEEEERSIIIVHVY